MLGAAVTTPAMSALIEDGAIACNERQRAAFWSLREGIPEAQRRAGGSLKHDISVPPASIPAFMTRVTAWVAAHVPEGLLICYGHAGDGNLHCNVSSRSGTDPARFQRRETEVRDAIHGIVQALHGSISAEHGIGQLKVAELRRYASPVKLALMRRLKLALDPNGIMNPGKVL
jgi:FAD/FMN-containing dehydrogenase